MHHPPKALLRERVGPRRNPRETWRKQLKGPGPCQALVELPPKWLLLLHPNGSYSFQPSGGWEPLQTTRSLGMETQQGHPESQHHRSHPTGPRPCFSCGQMGHFKRDCPLMECKISWEVHLSGWARANWHLPLTTPVHVGPKVVTAVLDTGNSVSMVCAHLVPEGRPPKS